MATRQGRSESSATILASGTPIGVVMQGYLLKKKRKLMQGLAKRYFVLSQAVSPSVQSPRQEHYLISAIAQGVLSYSFHPNGPVRDSVLVNTAFIHASRRDRAIHIDSGNTVMHCKALTEVDFDRWTQALRGFISGTVQESTTRGGRVASIGALDRPPVGLEAILSAVGGLSLVSRFVRKSRNEY